MTFSLLTFSSLIDGSASGVYYSDLIMLRPTVANATSQFVIRNCRHILAQIRNHRLTHIPLCINLWPVMLKTFPTEPGRSADASVSAAVSADDVPRARPE